MDEWINVEERLPQEKQYAMVAWDGLCAKRCAQGWICKVHPYVQASVHHSNSVTERVVVTHWMPMPKPPGEAEASLVSNAELQGQINRLWRELNALKAYLGMCKRGA